MKKNCALFILMCMCFALVACSGNQSSTSVPEKKEASATVGEGAVANSQEEVSEENKADDNIEDILDNISKGNSKVNSGINLISYGTATTLDGYYDEMNRGTKYFNDANSDYKAAIKLCGDNSEYATLKKRLQSVVDSVPPKPTASPDADIDKFSAYVDEFDVKYKNYIASVANLEAETETFTEKTGYIITSALKWLLGDKQWKQWKQ